jgi:hypothetical protein
MAKVDKEQQAWYAAIRKQAPATMLRNKWNGKQGLTVKPERKNSKRSRAHRLDQFMEEHRAESSMLLTSEVCRKKAEAINTMVNHWRDGMLSSDNLLRVVADIVRE